jgi:hypothetical protein
MSLESQAGRDTFGSTGGIVERRIRVQSELTTNCQIPEIRYARIPERKAIRVAIIASLVFSGAVEETMIVHLFSWIILVDINAISLDIVGRILYAVYSSCQRLFCNSYRIA